mmetsp:Transcript_86299/g.136205  ORF Transcript_86299/g.136205 Transcript_86299/m.136205 type:complete len:215 (-) Transcript_86299:1571-2215(-)
MRVGRIHFGCQETRLRSPCVRLDELGYWETRLQNLLGILSRSLKEQLEVGILLLVLISGIMPRLDRRATPNHNMKESIHQKNDILFHGAGIELHWLWRSLIESVLKQSWLDHDKRVHGINTDYDCPIEGCFIRTCIKRLQKVTAPQMVHELWEDAKLVGQCEARRVVCPVVCKFCHQANQGAIDPPQDVQGIFVICLSNCIPGHEDGCCFLVES